MSSLNSSKSKTQKKGAKQSAKITSLQLFKPSVSVTSLSSRRSSGIKINSNELKNPSGRNTLISGITLNEVKHMSYFEYVKHKQNNNNNININNINIRKSMNSSGSKSARRIERNLEHILENHQTEMKNSNLDNQLMDIVKLERDAVAKLVKLNRGSKFKMK